ncbi:MAG: hypothetical protein MUD01_04535 [Chloroflexaceae bacterium]|jgi:hypothetical protein|nr:hypothetical protein [Chloroflexaceae bacterium]
MPSYEPTIASILVSLAAEYDGPVEERRVFERVLEQRPSSAKNPYATIRERLRWDGPALGWLRLDRNQLVPLRVVLHGLRFRCIPSGEEVAAGLLPLVRLQPFISLRNPQPLLQDSNGTTLTLQAEATAAGRLRNDVNHMLPAVAARDWYAHTGFEPGDSVLLTVVATEPLTLQMVREAASDFRRHEVQTQEQELLDAITQRVDRSNLPLVPCDELVLPIFARSTWRTAYPGRPWQQLVASHPRLHLVDGIFVGSQRYEFIDDGETDIEREQQRHLETAILMMEIDALQHDVRQSRQTDADAGLWDGQIQPIASAYGEWEDLNESLMGIFEVRDDDDFLDIERLEMNEWELGDDFPPAFDDPAPADEPHGGMDMDDIRRRLFSVLTPAEIERWQDAPPEEAEIIIARHLNELLVKQPSLFVTLDLSAGPRLASDQAQVDQPFDSLWHDVYDLWDDDDDDDDWDDDWNDDLERLSQVYERSLELMNEFLEHLVASGKSRSTARWRTRSLWIYAEFLASHYGRTLAEGDYASMDECLFYFYPRKVGNSSPRQARELCTAVKQFYAFLRQRGDLDDDRFAQAIWRRREQAARMVELYERISRDAPDADLLLTRLFAPYV